MDSPYDMDPFIEDEVAEIDDEEDESSENDYIDEAENFKTTSTQDFSILSESDVKRLQEANITEISNVLSISRFAACLLLLHFDWSVNKVHEAWFDAEEKVRKAVGLLKEPQVCFLNSTILTCEICFQTLTCDMIKSAGCRHPYCINCWKQYVDTKMNEDPERCLKLRCPEPSCDAAVDGEMIHKFASESNKKKYDQFLLRSYVEKNNNMKWCPGPACDFVVLFEADDHHDARNKFDVTCLCYHSFCWNCGEDAHSPVDCQTVDQWIKTNNSESENTTWILAYTKPCPQCKKPIEKNQGCMHMTCKCGFHFCWLCLCDWSQCGYRGCNRFSNKQVQNFQQQNKEETKRKMAKEYIEKYIHYYERWASNEFSRKKALENLRAMHIKRLSVLHGKPETDFEFINEAWLQVVECRRVLKWTYAYGYYLPDNKKAKKEFFEYTQGEAEAALERLHHFAERELRKFLVAETLDGFNVFRPQLINLTNVTKNYFNNLVRALENGLADVHAESYSGVKRGSSETGETSNPRGTRRTVNIDGLTDLDLWRCEACGNYNVASATVCQDTMCILSSDDQS